MKNLNNLLQLLLENKIDFVLVGGFAGVAHGSTQVTRDLDICMLLDEAGIKKLRQCLKDIHPRHRMNPSFKPSFLEEPKNLEGIQNIYLETDLGVLDVLSNIIGVGNFGKLKSQAVEISLYGQKCKVISAEDLIRVKETLGRDKDKLVAQELRELLKLKKN